MARKLEWLNFWCPIGVGILACGAALRWPDLGSQLMAIGGSIIFASLIHQRYRLLPSIMAGVITGALIFFAFKVNDRLWPSTATPLTANEIAELVVKKLPSAQGTPAVVPNSPPFHLEPGGRPHIFSVIDFSKPSGFVAVGPPGEREVMIPASIILFVSISNLRQTAISVLGYDLAIGLSVNGPWFELCPINMLARKLYWVGLGMEKAPEIKRDNFLNKTLSGSAIEPGGIVSGWSAWRCSSSVGVGCLSDFFLYTIKDSTGAISQYVVTYGRSLMGANTLPLVMHIGEPRDLSSTKWTPTAPCGDGISAEYPP